MNIHASELGKMGKGKPKNFTEAEIERRRARLKEARKKRWRRRDSNPQWSPVTPQ